MEAIRTCLLCRNKSAKDGGVLRFVRAADGEICFDVKASAQSRGSWLCANRHCLTQGFKRRVLFRKEATLPVNEEVMMASIVERIKGQTMANLGLARKMGLTVRGRDAVKQLVLNGEAQVVMLASDLSPRSVKEVHEFFKGVATAEIQEIPMLMDELGKSMGSKPTGVVGMKKGRIINELLRLLYMLKNLSDERVPLIPASPLGVPREGAKRIKGLING